MATPEKTWWAPVRRGLVVDPEGKHVKRLNTAIALLIYLFVHADRRTGVVVRKYATIARDMGHAVRTIRRWMQRLDRYGYVRLTQTGRALVIEVEKWRPVGRDMTPLSGQHGPFREVRSDLDRHHGPRIREERRDKIDGAVTPNKIHIKRILLRERVVENFAATDAIPEIDDEGLVRRELLASDLAAGLGALDDRGRYLAYAARYPEPLLRRLLSEVRAVPPSRITRSRAAFFEYLLQRHGLSHTSAETEDPRA